MPINTSTAPSSGGNQQKTILNFSVARQSQDNWCWSAVATSISHFYDQFSTWTQCSTANAVLSRSDCCIPAIGSDKKLCDRQARLDIALTQTSNLVKFIDQRVNPISFSDIMNEIDSGKIIGTRIRWNGGGGGHFQAIYGYEVAPSGTEYIHIDDPIHGIVRISYNQFAASYKTIGGIWTHSYYTDTPSAASSGGGHALFASNDALDETDLIGA